MKKSRILAVVGPTAGGKTALSVELAKRAGGEVISCDSMQIYRGMDIGTAKPTEEEKQGVPHHLLDIAAPEEAFSVCDYVSAATAAADDILSRGKRRFLRNCAGATPKAPPRFTRTTCGV